LLNAKVADAACQIVDDTQHIKRLLSEPPTYYWGRVITSVNWTLQTRHTVHRGDMDIYFVMYRWSNCYTLQTKLLLRFTR